MKKKFCIGCLICVLFCLKGFSQNVSIVNDPVVNSSVLTQFVTQLTQLYEMYDHTMNQIQMIQQKYEQMQFYLNRAANWKWEDIKWDGDLDFRNEIAQATKQVDKELSNIRKLNNAFTSKTVTWGNDSYSLASLAGFPVEGQGNLEQFVANGRAYYEKGWQKACKVWEEGVPEEEAQYIWSKYGLTPANYKMVRDVEAKVQDVSKDLFSFYEETPEQIKIKKEKMQVIENIMDMLHQEGVTPDQIAEGTAMLQEQTLFALKELQTMLEKSIGYAAWKDALERQQAESDSQSKIERQQNALKSCVPSNW